MRIPLPIAIVLAIVMPLGIWWLGTRKLDFLTPPAEAQLIAIRKQTEASLPRLEIQPPKPAPKNPPSNAAPPVTSTDKPPDLTLEIGDLNPNPGLNTYTDVASKGPRYLIELASLLETSGEFARALLAWERVLDATTPEPAQAATASAALKRLRPGLPVWNRDSGKAIPIVLHATTGTKLEKPLKPILEQAAQDLQRASSGILKVSIKITPNRKNAPTNGPATVDIWLTGAAGKSPAADPISFTVTKPKTLSSDTLRKISILTSKRLGKIRPLPALPPVATDENPLGALEFRITRLSWQQFGHSLNAPPAPAP